VKVGGCREERKSSMEEYDASLHAKRISRKEKLILLMCEGEKEKTQEVGKCGTSSWLLVLSIIRRSVRSEDIVVTTV
jgi:hypothetical protein